MPNWCSNSLTISGEKDSVQRILIKLEMLEDNKGVFEELVGLGDIDQTQYNEGGWYHWNIDRFGTKWDVIKNDFMCAFSLLDEEDDETAFIVHFDTAWSPPSGFVLLLSEIYGVNVEIQSEEGGNDFFYRGRASEGCWDYEESYEFNQGQYLFNNDYFWDGIVQNTLEYHIEEEGEITKKEIQKLFPYIEDKKDIDEIISIAKEIKKEQCS
jgi:hypothetical protein